MSTIEAPTLTPREVYLRREVGDAAALLDERRGDDWRALIDPDTLDMMSPFNCILGQIGGWFEMKEALYGDPYDDKRTSPAFYEPETLPYWLEEIAR